MKLWWIKKTVNINIARLCKGCIYVLSDEASEQLEADSWKLPGKKSDFYQIFDFEDLFDPWTSGSGRRLLMLRSGGLGDIAALSVYGHFADKINLLTFNNYLPVTDLWSIKPTIHDLNGPVFSGIDFIRLNFLRKNYGYLDVNDIIEKGMRKNWYEVFIDLINKPFSEELGRPYFQRIVFPSKKYDIDILINNKATGRMRSMNLKHIVEAISKVAPHRRIFAFEYQSDGQKFDNVTFLDAKTSRQYVDFLLSAKDVITIDSAPAHIREGCRLPALALYFSFDSESRTKYYKYIQSVNLPAVCELQPCFLHGINPEDHCIMATDEELYAPCADRLFKDVVNYLAEMVNKYFKNT